MTTPRKRRMILVYVLVGILVVVLVVFGVLAMYVEDWSRDLSTNYAATSPTAEKAVLHPIDAALPVGELAELVKQTGAALPRWSLAEESTEGDAIKLHFVRATPLVGFKDDIRVTIKPVPQGSHLAAESQSRVGRGDLGQNPRNLAELLGAVRKKLATKET